MNLCHLALMRNDKQANRKRDMRECNKLKDEHDKMAEEMQYLGKIHDGLLVKHRKLINECN